MSQIPIIAGSDHMTTQIEPVIYCRMHAQETLRLDCGFEAPNPALSKPRCLVRLLRPVVRVSVRYVIRIRSPCPMGNPVTAQLRPCTRRFLISPANIGPNRFHQ